MDDHEARAARIGAIDELIRRITWQSHKQLLQTLSQPAIALTLPQMVTLFAIRGAGTCRMSELAEITRQSAGTLTGIVDRLIEDDLVGRVRDVDDRRVVQVTLTAQGKERLARVERFSDAARKTVARRSREPAFRSLPRAARCETLRCYATRAPIVPASSRCSSRPRRRSR